MHCLYCHLPEHKLSLIHIFFRQESGNLGETNAVAVMTGYLTVLLDGNDVADAQGWAVKIHRLFQVELFIQFFQLLRYRARLPQWSSVNEIIIAALYGNIMGL